MLHVPIWYILRSSKGFLYRYVNLRPKYVLYEHMEPARECISPRPKLRSTVCPRPPCLDLPGVVARLPELVEKFYGSVVSPKPQTHKGLGFKSLRVMNLRARHADTT